MSKSIIKTGDKFNFLTAIKFVELRRNSQQFWLFKCDCGKEKVISVGNVKMGATKSCGCLHKDMAKKTMKKTMTIHGRHGTKSYNSWQAMKDRCLNKNNPDYKNWGGRGIKVCDNWMKFENFYQDMGDRPVSKSLDRKDNDGNYCKSNCRWATPKQQASNRRKRKKVKKLKKKGGSNG